MSTYQHQCSVCFYICDLNLEVIGKFQANKTVRLVVFHTGKVCTIRPWKLPEIHTGIFDQMERALSFIQCKTLLTTGILNHRVWIRVLVGITYIPN